MFTIKADQLAATLDKVTSHRPGRSVICGDEILLEASPSWLHAVSVSDRTVAVARTEIAATTSWAVPIDAEEVDVLRSWLVCWNAVGVRVALDLYDGPALHFSVGAAQVSLPVLAEAAVMPWREALAAEIRPNRMGQRQHVMRASDLDMWSTAGGEIEVRPAARDGAFVVTAADFIGVQFPESAAPERVCQDSWKESLQARSFLYKGKEYQVGGLYAGPCGHTWRILAEPAPGREPIVMSTREPVARKTLSTLLSSCCGPLERIM
ncbi:hypothetical protein ACFIN9_26625 [Streptomyces noursei]|uniref:hypothetical protein n=1 Tax=Streptomyces noursei TaxID=1971 RepID=UPI0036D3A763